MGFPTKQEKLKTKREFYVLSIWCYWMKQTFLKAFNFLLTKMKKKKWKTYDKIYTYKYNNNKIITNHLYCPVEHMREEQRKLYAIFRLALFLVVYCWLLRFIFGEANWNYGLGQLQHKRSHKTQNFIRRWNRLTICPPIANMAHEKVFHRLWPYMFRSRFRNNIPFFSGFSTKYLIRIENNGQPPIPFSHLYLYTTYNI